MSRPLRLSLAGCLAAAVLPAAGLAASGLGSPAVADHVEPQRVTLMGSLMDELGCDAEWDEDCTATDLVRTDQPGGWELVAKVPAGTYEWKVRLDGSWDNSYGTPDGGNVPLRLTADTRLRFRYDNTTHAVSIVPVRAPAPLGSADRALVRDSLRASLTREQFYFVMADRFANGNPGNDDAGLGGDRLVSGLDPTDTAFFHGGDLQGVIDRLDYIQGLGSTAIWLTPSFKNKPVQGAPGSEAAGYHGYWITDFTKIDPHLGTNADMKQLVRLAHRRGLKVFFDIITNHTADVITYDRGEYGPDGALPYVSTADEPYRDADGTEFDDRDYADGSPPFPRIDAATSFPYAPVVPEGEAEVKVPRWLNDPRYYHNRGTSTFTGEDNTYGDFPSGEYSSLDDLWTEHPRVVQGMTDVYRTWVREVGIDGFRIDTVKHVNTEFWQQFSPALTRYAAGEGNRDFFMFGEVFDANPAFVSQYTTEGRLQAAVDFGFQSDAVGFAKGGDATDLRDFYASDDWYTDTDSNAYQLPTFLGNHDMGRVGSFLRDNDQGWSEGQLLQRDRFAHTLMYLTRGQPIVYYGDEQGFSAPKGVPGGIGDQRAREDMFPSRVDLYNGYDLIGSDDTTATSNFRTNRPLYRTIAALAALRKRHPALADGAQVPRYAADGAGVFAVSRVDARREREYVVALNNATTPQSAAFDTFTPGTTFEQVWPAPTRRGQGTVRSGRGGRLSVTVPALGARVWRATRPVRGDGARPTPTFTAPADGGVVGGRAEVGVEVPGDDFTQVTFAWRRVGATRWTPLGTDDNAPFRVFHDVRDLPHGTLVEYRAVARDSEGRLGVAQRAGWVGDPPVVVPPSTEAPDSVSVPGSFNDEVGCSAEWAPACPQVDLAYDETDEVWSATFEGDSAIPAGGYAYKAAINDEWDENYGVGAERDGPNIPLTAPGGPVTFYYSHDTHWVTNSVETPHLFTAPGSYQSELGCPGDWLPDCLRSWLQDPDGDDVWTFRTERIPAGDYETKAAQDQSFTVNWGAGGVPDGPNISFSVAEGDGVEFSFDEATKVLTVATYDPDA